MLDPTVALYSWHPDGTTHVPPLATLLNVCAEPIANRRIPALPEPVEETVTKQVFDELEQPPFDEASWTCENV